MNLTTRPINLNFTAEPVEIITKDGYYGEETWRDVAALFINGEEVWRDDKQQSYIDTWGDGGQTVAEVVIEHLKKVLNV